MSHPGYANGSEDVNTWLLQLEKLINDVPVLMRSIDPGTLLWRKAENAWSSKEIIGHLIDSGINNLKRFTEAQFAKGTYTYATYSPDNLVRINRYQEMELEDILQLWKSLNRQVVHVIRLADPVALQHPVQPNVEGSPIRTVAWIFCDFVGHIQHHLRQVNGILQQRSV